MITIVSAGVASIATIVGIILTRRKSREDTELANFAQAIKAWKELAENHKHLQDDCEKKFALLLEKFETTKNELSQLKIKVQVLNLQLKGQLPLDGYND